MRFTHSAWIPLAWLGSVANLGAVWFAAVPAEPAHATLHAGLAVALALGARQLMARRQAALPGPDLQQALDANEQLQQMIDTLKPRVQELEERLDFTERMLVQHREAGAS
jgi:hypothetical protein